MPSEPISIGPEHRFEAFPSGARLVSPKPVYPPSPSSFARFARFRTCSECLLGNACSECSFLSTSGRSSFLSSSGELFFELSRTAHSGTSSSGALFSSSFLSSSGCSFCPCAKSNILYFQNVVFLYFQKYAKPGNVWRPRSVPDFQDFHYFVFFATTLFCVSFANPILAMGNRVT